MANFDGRPKWWFEGTYLKVGEIADSKVIVLERSPVPSGDSDLKEIFDPVEQSLRGIRREQYGLLIDMRVAKGRNDAEFEKKFEPIRQSIQRGFCRVAIVVATPQGKLQAGRYSREDRLPNSVFDDYRVALNWLEEVTLRPSP